MTLIKSHRCLNDKLAIRERSTQGQKQIGNWLGWRNTRRSGNVSAHSPYKLVPSCLSRNVGRLIDGPSVSTHEPSCPPFLPHTPRMPTLRPFITLFYKLTNVKPRTTSSDLASHPLLPSLQSCDSPEAVLTVLREQIPGFNHFKNVDDRLPKWVAPTVNACIHFSLPLVGVGLVNIGMFAREEFPL